MIKGRVAIVGRPNVGKSTLFNRLTKKNDAIIHDRPGVTRDRLYGVVQRTNPQEDREQYFIIDTGGFETDDFNYQPFQKNEVWQQTAFAIDEADVVVLVFDGKSGLQPHDTALVRYLQKQDKPTIYVVNKIDGLEQSTLMWEFYSLGLEEILTCSSAHNRGVWELSEAIEAGLDTQPNLIKKHGATDSIKISLIGRPNVGKSSILNHLTGETRSIVSDIAGTTRDSIDAALKYNGQSYTIVDTAGIRRKSRIEDKVESLSVLKSLRSLEASDVVILVVGPDGLSDQDARLASLAHQQYKPILIVVNKWDLVPDKTALTHREVGLDIKAKLKNMDYVPLLFISCKTNQRVSKILAEVERLAKSYHERKPTAQLNACLQEAVYRHTPALVRKYNKRVKFYFATQVRTAPPTIVVKCNVANEIQDSYKRYLTHQFRKRLGYGPIPLRVIFRDKAAESKYRQTNQELDASEPVLESATSEQGL